MRIVRIRRYPTNTPPLVCCASHPSQVGTVRHFGIVTVMTVKNTGFLMTPCNLMKISEPAAFIVRTEYCLFGCNFVQSSGHLWTVRGTFCLRFQSRICRILPPPPPETLVKFCQTVLRHISE